MKLPEFPKALGHERLRVALALLALSFFAFIYTMNALLAPPEWRAMMLGLGACYLAAFLALAAEWFWGRWFAAGLGYSGAMVGLLSLVMIGVHPALIVYGGLHVVVVATLWGPRVAARYELQTAWREKYGLDEPGVAKLGKTVTRSAASLPTLIMWALAPRTGQGLAVWAVLAAFLGLAGLLRMRTWALLALTGAAVAATLSATPAAVVALGTGGAWTVWAPAPVSSLWLLAAVLPFVPAAWRFVRSR